MRSLLEKAIEHVLNEEHDKANLLFHKFMVERARQIHESLRQGDEVVLTEGWDDEIVSEEYFSDTDLNDSGEMGTDDATDQLTSDEDVNPDEVTDTETTDTDVDTTDVDDMDGMDDDKSTKDKLDDFEAELEKLTAEFKEMISSIDVDGDSEDTTDEDMSDENPDMSMDDSTPDDSTDTTDVAPEDNTEGEPEVTEGDEEDMWENYDLDDITESVISELEKITVDSTTDGKMTDGKKIVQNTKSNLPMKPVNQREGGTPAKSPFTKNDSFARETPPASKQIPHGKLNSYKKTSDLENSVKPKGDPNAALNKDFAGGPKPSKSPIAGK
jgi:hypothetical protein